MGWVGMPCWPSRDLARSRIVLLPAGFCNNLKKKVLPKAAYAMRAHILP